MATALAEDDPENWKPSPSFYLAFSSLCIIILAAALDATSLSVALPIIADDLGGSAIEAFWAGTSFLLSSTVFQPTFASASHAFGRKATLVFAVVCFAVGSLVAALSRDFTALLAGRTVQGIGGGGIVSLTEVLITDLVPLRYRGTWFGIQSLAWAVGSIVGPLIGGAFAEYASWRWIFWINLPICALGLVVLVFFLHLNKREGSVAARFRAFDFVGAALLTASVTSVLIPISWGGIVFAWYSWHTLVPLILGIAGGGVFILHELNPPATTEPLIPLTIFKQRTAYVNYLGTFIQGVVLWCLVYYLPLYYEAVKDYGLLTVGVAVFPETFAIAPASIVVGIIISKTGHFRWSIWTGWSLATLGLGLCYLLDANTSIPAWIFLNLVPSIGIGMLYNSLAFATQAAAVEKEAAFAAAMYTFMRSFGQAIGVAVGGVIFQSRLTAELQAGPLAANATQLASQASSLVQVIKALPEGSVERVTLVHAYADALKVLWAAMAGFALVALLASLFTEGLSIDRKLETEQSLQHASKEG